MPIKIHLLTITPLGILIVYFTDGDCWQFRVLSSGGAVFGEKAGRDWVGSGW